MIWGVNKMDIPRNSKIKVLILSPFNNAFFKRNLYSPQYICLIVSITVHKINIFITELTLLGWAQA